MKPDFLCNNIDLPTKGSDLFSTINKFLEDIPASADLSTSSEASIEDTLNVISILKIAEDIKSKMKSFKITELHVLGGILL